MFRAVVEEAAALASLALFLGMIAIWAQVDRDAVRIEPRRRLGTTRLQADGSRRCCWTGLAHAPHDRAASWNREGWMAGPGFVHLHVHSSYSLLEGALTIARLAELAKADRQPALALTDTDNMFGALEFSEKLAGYGIQPIVGCSLAVDFGDQEATGRRRSRRPCPRIVLLAAREDGYRSLMRLNSRAFLETSPTEQPHIKLSWLEGETAGLIALTGGPGGPLDAAIEAGQNALVAARASTRWRGSSATGSMSSCSATARSRARRSRAR